MTATPPDPLAKQHDGTTDPDQQAPVDDEQTLRLREENRALRDLLAAQVHATHSAPQPSWLSRLFWWLISAPGAALVGWRSLLGRDASNPLTRRSVGSATLTVLYTLAIYGALVLLVVSWNSPNSTLSGSTAASPVRVPLLPAPPLTPDAEPARTPALEPVQEPGKGAGETEVTPAPAPATPPPEAPQNASPSTAVPSSSPAPSSGLQPPLTAEEPPASGTTPHSTLRMTEIPPQNPLAWVDALKTELARCAELGFFDRPNCAWEARRQFCAPNHGWGSIKECPAEQ
ncbi:hypothetical protein RAS12_09790 [Achromobacter seleniivolatilans]|uniref:Uncharacterized protein n=1 Tax=Achromobacter seleniivolatilans TaxID=3047478 RepID=A0ABY9M7J0_9BURK|nr:hypothetical protein [Achromobacter sp. R39]WMD22647.1 hypothetical protein RAS12_09790 [Achromobacter sp. R39]